MLNLRKFFAVLVVGGLGGVFAGGFLLPFFVRTNFLGAAAILDKIYGRQPVITKIEERTIIVPQSGFFSEAVKKNGPSVVAVQSFSGGRLVRYGSGVALTQDGLIATLNSVVPLNAEVFQVFGGGKVYKAKVVFRDNAKNVALVSVSEAGFQVVRLKSDLPDLGQGLLIFSQTVSFSKESPFVGEALVSRRDEKDGTFEISASYDYRLYGSALIDGEGAVLGLVDFKNQKPVVVFSKTIEDAFDAYLAGLAASKP